MATEFWGECEVELDGSEASVQSISATTATGKKRVDCMGKTGFVRGKKRFDLTLKAVKAINESSPEWEDIEGAKLTISPVGAPGNRTSFIDCHTISVGEEYAVEGEMVQDVILIAFKKVKE